MGKVLGISSSHYQKFPGNISTASYYFSCSLIEQAILNEDVKFGV